MQVEEKGHAGKPDDASLAKRVLSRKLRARAVRSHNIVNQACANSFPCSQELRFLVAGCVARKDGPSHAKGEETTGSL